MTTKLRDDAQAIFAAALAGGQAGNAVRAAVRRSSVVLRVRGARDGDARATGKAKTSEPHPNPDANRKRVTLRYNLARFSRIFVIGAGKAAGPMAEGLEAALGPWAKRIHRGLILAPPGDSTRLRFIRKREAPHPVPGKEGMRGARQILDILQEATADDLVIALVSGGSSAMTALPAPGVSLRDFQALTRELLRSGASIADMNVVRKHLSLSVGGRMAEAAHPARTLVLVASDVEGNRLDVIGSGPFAADPSTYRDAARILRARKIWNRCAPGIRKWIARGQAGEIAETPKPGDPRLRRVQHVIILDRSHIVAEAVREARKRGFRVRHLDRRQASFGPIAQVAAAHLRAVRREAKGTGKIAWISSGEAEVLIPPNCRGRGGRNQELALRLGLAFATSAFLREQDFAVLCGGTDGIDGPTDAAGAWVDRALLTSASANLDSARHSIQSHDSYHFFRALGQGLLYTGRTGTNLLDLRIVLLRLR